MTILDSVGTPGTGRPGTGRPGAAAGSLPEILRERGRSQPDDLAFVFLANGEDPGPTLTFRGLDEAARSTAAALHAAGVVGGRSALLVYPAGLDFVSSLMGCMYAGVAGAPVQVPSRLRGLERVRRIADDAHATVLLTVASVRDELLAKFGDSPLLDGLTLIATDELPPAAPEDWTDLTPLPDDIALLQYTSGSTGDPKGVMVSHANFLANAAETDELWPTGEDGVYVSWLPHFHDMGMLFGVIVPIFMGAPSYLMSPEAFIRRPGRWTEAISRFGGTHSAAPSFAYELCVREAREKGIEPGTDLSGWRVAANGAEPVRWSVVEDFTAAFAPAGFRPETMCPGYGLAENTLKATGSPGDRVPAVRWVSSEALREDRVETVDPADPRAVALVGSGVPVPGTRIRIVSPGTLKAVEDGRVGEIWIGGPCVAGGYFGRAVETAEVFNARVAGEDRTAEYLRTGDLGFLHDGELYVAGRLKDVIIRKGRNFYPQDIELTVERTTEGLHPNCSAAFSVDDGTSERLVVIVEADGRVLKATGAQELSRRIEDAVHEGQRLIVDEVVITRRGSLPKTSSGKVQRRLARIRYLDGEFVPAGAAAVQGGAA
jgi:acyl-CoA synthetase (AMP-forming)/AMP-acid ligase II